MRGTATRPRARCATTVAARLLSRSLPVISLPVVLVSALLVLTAAAPAAAAAADWQWPLRPAPAVAKPFDPPLHDWLPGNRGVDLSGRPGEQVRAAGTGIVSFAGQVAGVGVVSILSGSLRTTYEPLRVLVHRGDPVTAGQPIGRLTQAGSHCPPMTCLHWGLLRGTTYLDPLALLGLAQVRLLPQGDGSATPVAPPAIVLSFSLVMTGLSRRWWQRRQRRRLLRRAATTADDAVRDVAAGGPPPPGAMTWVMTQQELEDLCDGP